MNKKQENMLWAYNHAKAETLDQAYKSYSRAKREAYHDCLKLQAELNGWGGRITGASCYYFSYAFQYMKDGKKHLCYITKSHDYLFCIE